MLRAIATSARLSNLPTVWTNVLVGAAAAGWAAGDDARTAWLPLIVALLTVSLLYSGGMFLNDVVDAEWDRAHKRDRPIARGDIRRATLGWLALACLIVAIVIPVTLGVLTPGNRASVAVCGVQLVVLIALYNMLHKQTAWSVLIMGLCRAAVYTLSVAMLIGPDLLAKIEAAGGHFRVGDARDLVIAPARAMIVYIALLTFAARREDKAGARIGRLWVWLVPTPFLVAAFWYRPEAPIWAVLIGAGFTVWAVRSARLARAGRVPGAVSGWLAGICLADGMLLMLMDRPWLAGIAVVCWGCTVLAQTRISGT